MAARSRRAASVTRTRTSPQPAPRSSGFKANHRLPFVLLSDPGGRVAKAWGLTSTLGIPPRVTFVFDKEGVVRLRFDSKIRFGKHVEDALEVVKKLPR